MPRSVSTPVGLRWTRQRSVSPVASWSRTTMSRLCDAKEEIERLNAINAELMESGTGKYRSPGRRQGRYGCESEDYSASSTRQAGLDVFLGSQNGNGDEEQRVAQWHLTTGLFQTPI